MDRVGRAESAKARRSRIEAVVIGLVGHDGQVDGLYHEVA